MHVFIFNIKFFCWLQVRRHVHDVFSNYKKISLYWYLSLPCSSEGNWYSNFFFINLNAGDLPLQVIYVTRLHKSPCQAWVTKWFISAPSPCLPGSSLTLWSQQTSAYYFYMELNMRFRWLNNHSKCPTSRQELLGTFCQLVPQSNRWQVRCDRWQVTGDSGQRTEDRQKKKIQQMTEDSAQTTDDMW